MHGLYKKLPKKKNVKGTKTYIPMLLVVWKVANIECSLCWGPYMHYIVSQNPQNRSQEVLWKWDHIARDSNPVSMCR